MDYLSFHPDSGVEEIEPGVEYAGVLVRGRSQEPWGRRMRPVKVIHNPSIPDVPIIIDPLIESNTMIFTTMPVDLGLLILGLWDGPAMASSYGGSSSMTWQGYAAQQLGEVMRQRDLAQRLTDFGIPRSPQGYTPMTEDGNAVERDLTLNYDELDRLLRAAGF